jgi:hypothetical protein
VRYKSGASAVDADENVYEEDEIDRLIARLADDDLSACGSSRGGGGHALWGARPARLAEDDRARQSKQETQDALRRAARAETRWRSGSDNSASACDAGALVICVVL